MADGNGEHSEHRLFDAFTAEMQRRANVRQPSSVRAAMERFGWGSKEVAERFGVSQRTARRWRQQNRVPDKSADRWRQAVRDEQTRRMRERIERRGLKADERRGLKGLQVTGKYRVSGNPRYEYKSNPWSPVRLLEGNRITPAQMRAVFAAADAGDLEQAEQLLADALAEGYGMSGGMGVEWTDVDGIEFDIP